MRICSIIPPRREDIIGNRTDGYLGDCILPGAHFCPHVIKTPEGKYFEWSDDNDCDCCDHGVEDDQCYTFCEITEKEFQKYRDEEAKRLQDYEKGQD